MLTDLKHSQLSTGSMMIVHNHNVAIFLLTGGMMVINISIQNFAIITCGYINECYVALEKIRMFTATVQVWAVWFG